jgi:predicted alpha/beta hydrolase
MSPQDAQPVVIRCADGYGLHGTFREGARRRRRNAAVIVCPAIFVRQRFYQAFAAYFASQGFDTLTLANRGMGESLAGETRRWRHRLRDWAEVDLPAAITHVKDKRPDQRLYVVGHSMGGQLVALTDSVHRLDGIVTVAATAAWWGHWPFPANLGILAWYRLATLLSGGLRVFPAERFGLGPNVSADLVRDWVTWGQHRSYLGGPFGLNLQMAAYRGRLLVYSFADDELGCRQAVAALHRDYRQAKVTCHHVHPRETGTARIGHFGYFRSKAGPQLWQQTMAWMEG